MSELLVARPAVRGLKDTTLGRTVIVLMPNTDDSIMHQGQVRKSGAKFDRLMVRGVVLGEFVALIDGADGVVTGNIGRRYLIIAVSTPVAALYVFTHPQYAL